MISLKNINAFVNVAKFQSFALASEHLHLSQPALSSSIKNLEQALGGDLFVRSTRRVSLTPEGETFLPLAKRLLADLDSAVLDLKQLFSMESGLLSLAAMPSFAHSKLPDLLVSFGYAQPNLGLRIIDEVMENVLQCVLDGRAEIGFVFSPENNSRLRFTPLFDEEFILITPADYPSNSKDVVDMQEVACSRFIAMNRGSSTRDWVDRAFGSRGLALDVVCEASQFATIGNLVSKGLGVSIVPYMCKQQMEMKGCRCFTINDLNLTRAIGFVTSEQYNLSIAAKAFIDMVKAHF